MLNHPNGPLRSVERPTADVLAVLHYDGGVQVNVCFWSIASSRRLARLGSTAVDRARVSQCLRILFARSVN
jgi:hypothetical protein